MKPWARAALALAALLSGAHACAHRLDEYLQATLLTVEPGHVHATMRLIPGALVAEQVIAGIDSNGDGQLSAPEQQAYAQRVLGDLSIAVDNGRVQPRLRTWTFPSPADMRQGLGEISIEYDVDVPGATADAQGRHRFVVENRHVREHSVYLVNVLAPTDAGIRIESQQRDAQQSRYELAFQDAGGASATPAQDAPALGALFHLGMRHIADGTDHLLFLLALLLPAPLLRAGARWGPAAPWRGTLLRMLGIVTAFSVGHSITLTAAALGGWALPGRPVEVLIAGSILVSAAHALRPLFPGREAGVAGLFGLVHGLAFAAVLDRLGLGLWSRVAGTLAFNLGIEAMQLLVVAAVLPSLLLLGGTRGYAGLRVAGAAFAGAAALAWLAERALGVDLHVDALAGPLARLAPWLAVALLVAGVTARRGALARGLAARFQRANSGGGDAPAR
jgi:hypothetical protein